MEDGLKENSSAYMNCNLHDTALDQLKPSL